MLLLKAFIATCYNSLKQNSIIFAKTPASNITLAERDTPEATFRPWKTCLMQRFDFNAQNFPINDRVQFHQ